MSQLTRLLGALAVTSTLAGCGGSQPDAVDVSTKNQGIARPDPAPLEHPTAAPTTAAALPPPSAWSLFGKNMAPPSSNASGLWHMFTPCEPGKNESPGFGDVCGTKGRVAVEFMAHGFVNAEDAPCQLVGFVRRPAKGAPPAGVGDLHAACVAGQELLASSECRMCRIPMGWAFHGRVDEMTRAQSVALLDKMDAHDVEPPASAKGWAELIERSKVAALPGDGALPSLASVTPSH